MRHSSIPSCKDATKMEPCVLTTPCTTAPKRCPPPACCRCFTKSTGTRQTPAASSPRMEATKPMPQ